MTSLPARQILRRAALATALLLAIVPTAFADAPGYELRDLNRPLSSLSREPAAIPARLAADPDGFAATGLGETR